MPTEFRLVANKWDRELSVAVSADRTHLRVICPFIQKRSAERLLSAGTPGKIQVITRFSTRDFCDRVMRPRRASPPSGSGRSNPRPPQPARQDVCLRHPPGHCHVRQPHGSGAAAEPRVRHRGGGGRHRGGVHRLFRHVLAAGRCRTVGAAGEDRSFRARRGSTEPVRWTNSTCRTRGESGRRAEP